MFQMLSSYIRSTVSGVARKRYCLTYLAAGKTKTKLSHTKRIALKSPASGSNPFFQEDYRVGPAAEDFVSTDEYKGVKWSLYDDGQFEQFDEN